MSELIVTCGELFLTSNRQKMIFPVQRYDIQLTIVNVRLKRRESTAFDMNLPWRINAVQTRFDMSLPHRIEVGFSITLTFQFSIL